MDRLTNVRTITSVKIVSTALINTSAGGYIPINTLNSDAARTSGVNWSSYASRFQQFRVKSIYVRLFPLVDVTTALTAGGGAVTPHPGPIAFAAYREGTGYASYNAIVAGADSTIFNGREKILSYSVDWSNNREAKLWSSTNAAIPTAYVFGMQFSGADTGPTSSASTTYYRMIAAWDVEFVDPQ